ncbi:MAG TPA: YheC/YheD family protein [Sphingobacteriaceae bacterium]|nr:YheC/YheD family protein [Sphingobacteriaceae bacterium]
MKQRQDRSRRRRGTLGVLAYRHDRPFRMWGEQTDYLAGVLEAAGDLGLRAFAFGPQDVHLARGRVRAWVRRGGRWRSRWLGLPTLVYDRFFLRKEPQAGRYLASYRRLKASGRLRFISPDLPDKWQVHRVLRGAPDLHPHLPPSLLYKGPATAATAAARWGALVFKPIRGQKGLGLWFALPQGRGRWRVVGGSTGSGSIKSREQFLAWCHARLRPGKYMVQKYLALTDPAGRPRDIRVLVQRGPGGQIIVTGMGARIGRPGTMVANLHRGGRGMPVPAAVDRVVPPGPDLVAAATHWVSGAEPGNGATPDGAVDLQDAGDGQPWHGRSFAPVEQHLAWVAVRVFQVLNQAFGRYAELAIDLGVDAEGRIWFIEANSRPGRIIFRRIGDLEGRRHAIRMPLLYARHLMTAGT